MGGKKISTLIKKNKDLSKIIANLPDPIFSKMIAGIRIEIYKIKDMDQPKINSADFKDLLEICRSSFSRYGYVPEFDEYDRKASIYLGRAIYTIPEIGKKERVEEWVTLRFVPADNKPLSNIDLEQCSYQGKKLFDWLSNKYTNSCFPRFENFISLSRFAGIKPYLRRVNGEIIQEKIYSKINYSSLMFLLINHVFFEEAMSRGLPFLFLSSLMVKKLQKKLFNFELLNKKFYIKMSSAYKRLNCSKQDIKIIRDKYTYNYPGYFFDIYQLAEFIKKKARENIVSLNTLKHYLGGSFELLDLDLKNVEVADALYKLKNLGILFLTDGKLHGSQITGEEWRFMASKKIGDGPELKIEKVEVFRKQLRSAVNKLFSFNDSFYDGEN